jgi:hypothetical protein
VDVVLVRVGQIVVYLVHLTAAGPVDPARTSLIAAQAVDALHR